MFLFSLVEMKLRQDLYSELTFLWKSLTGNLLLQLFLDTVVTGRRRWECLNVQLAQETWERGSLEKGFWTKPTYRCVLSLQQLLLELLSWHSV